MEVTLLKDWAGLSKGDKYSTDDKDVLSKGGDLGLWKKVAKKDLETTEEDNSEVEVTNIEKEVEPKEEK